MQHVFSVKAVVERATMLRRLCKLFDIVRVVDVQQTDFLW
jgi:hypothetical protein